MSSVASLSVLLGPETEEKKKPGCTYRNSARGLLATSLTSTNPTGVSSFIPTLLTQLSMLSNVKRIHRPIRVKTGLEYAVHGE